MPTMHNVALSDKSVATVPICYVTEMLLLFLNDPAQMLWYLFAGNYDPFTA